MGERTSAPAAGQITRGPPPAAARPGPPPVVVIAASELTSSAIGSHEVAMGASGVPVRIVRDLLGLAPGDAFDADVDRAVRAFQAARGLVADGCVGPVTWAALRVASAPAHRTDLVRGAEGEQVRWVQRRLGITVDARFDARTEAAVRAFQRARRLAPDGRVGAVTWAALLE